MTLDELGTIVGMMNNDCPGGTSVYMVHVVNTEYDMSVEPTRSNVDGRLQFKVIRDGTVPRNVCVAVMWRRPGHVDTLIGKYSTLNAGFPCDVQLEERKGGKVSQYVNLIKWMTA